MLREWFGTVITCQADLLSWRLDEFAAVPGDGEFAGPDVKPCALKL